LKARKTDIEIYFTLSPENPPLIQEYHIREIPKEIGIAAGIKGNKK
jgi:hypothetical protein